MINKKKVLFGVPKYLDNLNNRVCMPDKGTTVLSGVTYILKEGVNTVYSFEKDLSCTNDTDVSDTPIVDDVSGTLVEEPLVIRGN